MRHYSLTLLVGLILLATPARSAISKNLAVCGSSEGFAYFAKKGIAATSSDASKWQSDKIGGGKITLVQLEQNKHDILIADATGSVFSSIQNGAAIVRVGRTRDALAYIVNYGGATVETYVFSRDSAGKYEVLWTSAKYAGPITKIASYRAACRSIEFN